MHASYGPVLASGCVLLQATCGCTPVAEAQGAALPRPSYPDLDLP